MSLTRPLTGTKVRLCTPLLPPPLAVTAAKVTNHQEKSLSCWRLNPPLLDLGPQPPWHSPPLSSPKKSNTKLSHGDHKQRSLMSLPPTASWWGIWVHTTESHPVQQSTSIKCPIKIFDKPSETRFRPDPQASSRTPCWREKKLRIVTFICSIYELK